MADEPLPESGEYDKVQPSTPFTRATLLAELAAAEREVGEFFGSLDGDAFVARPGSAWSPAEHLQHLSIATGAVAYGLGLPRWLLRLRFGRARSASRSYERLRDDYRTRLEEGGQATGRFVPVREETPAGDGVLRRTHLLARWYRVNEKLLTALEKWTEHDLDRIRMPHPLLGKLTAREMVLFTIYHDRHHIAAARRRVVTP